MLADKGVLLKDGFCMLKPPSLPVSKVAKNSAKVGFFLRQRREKQVSSAT
jgi:hypothetical protein